MTQRLWRLGAGTLTTAALAASSTYLITSWSGQTAACPWLVAADYLVTPYVERETTLSNFDKAQGKLNFTWRFAKLNDVMFDYLVNTVFGGAYTAVVTVKTRNRFFDDVVANQWQTYNGIGRLPDFRLAGVNARQWTFYSPFEVQFYDCVTAAAS